MATIFKRRTIKEIIYGMEGSFVPENAADLDVVIQYSFSGEGGGDYYVTVKDQKVAIHEGVHPAPTLTFLTSAEDYILMDSGELDGVKAFFARKLKVQGDTKLAAKLPRIFKPREI